MNKYPFNTPEYRAYEQGRADTNDKWRAAIVGKLPATEQREVRSHG